MDLLSEPVAGCPNATAEVSIFPAQPQLTDFELCLVAGGMGDVQQ